MLGSCVQGLGFAQDCMGKVLPPWRAAAAAAPRKWMVALLVNSKWSPNGFASEEARKRMMGREAEKCLEGWGRSCRWG